MFLNVCMLMGLSAGSNAFAATKLLQSSDLTYLGAFRAPYDSGLAYGGSGMAYNSANNSLFITGHVTEGKVLELNIPAPVISADTSNMNTASIRQSAVDITEGNGAEIDSGGANHSDNAVYRGGLLVHGSKLIGTSYAVYDGSHSADLSHYTSNMTLSSSGDFAGYFKVGNDMPGFVAGYMGNIPVEYQSALGGTALTGKCDLSIIGRTSYGPSAYSFDPARLGLDNTVTAHPLVNYPIDHQTLGIWTHPLPASTSNSIADTIGGIAFPNDTKSILFVGTHGKGQMCYGDGGGSSYNDGVSCIDPMDINKGVHSYPYVMYVWAYNVDDFITVKNGTKNPWEIAPYAVWELPVPNTADRQNFWGPTAAAYDASNKKLYVSQPYADTGQYDTWGLPLIHVYSVNTGGASDTTAPSAPTGLSVQ